MFGSCTNRVGLRFKPSVKSGDLMLWFRFWFLPLKIEFFAPFRMIPSSGSSSARTRVGWISYCFKGSELGFRLQWEKVRFWKDFGGGEIIGMAEWWFRSEVWSSISGVCDWIRRAKISFLESMLRLKEVLIGLLKIHMLNEWIM